MLSSLLARDTAASRLRALGLPPLAHPMHKATYQIAPRIGRVGGGGVGFGTQLLFRDSPSHQSHKPWGWLASQNPENILPERGDSLHILFFKTKRFASLPPERPEIQRWAVRATTTPRTPSSSRAPASSSTPSRLPAAAAAARRTPPPTPPLGSGKTAITPPGTGDRPGGRPAGRSGTSAAVS